MENGILLGDIGSDCWCITNGGVTYSGRMISMECRRLVSHGSCCYGNLCSRPRPNCASFGQDEILKPVSRVWNNTDQTQATSERIVSN